MWKRTGRGRKRCRKAPHLVMTSIADFDTRGLSQAASDEALATGLSCLQNGLEGSHAIRTGFQETMFLGPLSTYWWFHALLDCGCKKRGRARGSQHARRSSSRSLLSSKASDGWKTSGSQDGRVCQTGANGTGHCAGIPFLWLSRRETIENGKRRERMTCPDDAIHDPSLRKGYAK